jgi:hypothetical protein
LCLLFVNMCLMGYAITWHSGAVVLTNGTVLAGDCSVEEARGIVLRRNDDGTASVYPAYKITSVWYYDKTLDINRRFLSFPVLGSARRHELIELVSGGEIPIFRKAKSFIDRNTNADRDAYEYFFRFENEFISIRHFANRIYPVVKHTVSGVVKVERLNIHKDADAVKIILNYNELRKSDLLAANGL